MKFYIENQMLKTCQFFKELENSILVNFRGVGDLEVPSMPNTLYHFGWHILQNRQNRQILNFLINLLQTKFGYLEVLNMPNPPSPLF